MPVAKTKKVVLFGMGDLAAIGLEYFSNDSEYEVVGFTVDRKYLPEHELWEDCQFLGLPLVAFDNLKSEFPPSECELHVCMIYNNLNRDRENKCAEAKRKGYKLASYISSHAFVSPSAKIGEHAFIFENNVIQPFVTIGDNCVLWSGNHAGHHSTIGSNVFISSHVVISGHCKIGDNIFIGVNSTLANNTVIGKETWVSHGSMVPMVVPERSFVAGGVVKPLNEAALNRALDRARR